MCLAAYTFWLLAGRLNVCKMVSQGVFGVDEGRHRRAKYRREAYGSRSFLGIDGVVPSPTCVRRHTQNSLGKFERISGKGERGREDRCCTPAVMMAYGLYESSSISGDSISYRDGKHNDIEYPNMTRVDGVSSKQSSLGGQETAPARGTKRQDETGPGLESGQPTTLFGRKQTDQTGRGVPTSKTAHQNRACLRLERFERVMVQ